MIVKGHLLPILCCIGPMIFETAMDKEQSFVAVIIINARAFIATLSWERPKVKRVRIREKSKRKSGKDQK